MQRILFLSNSSIEVEISGPSPDTFSYPLAPSYSEISLHNVKNIEVLDCQIGNNCLLNANNSGLSSLVGNNCTEYKVKTPPLFFEDCEYMFMISEKKELKEANRLNEPLRFFGAPLERMTYSKNNATLFGILRMHGEVGIAECEIRKGRVILMSFTLEFFPSKMDYRNDYKMLLHELESEIHGLTYNIFCNTFSRAEPLKVEKQSILEWLSLLRSLFAQFVSAYGTVVKMPHRVMQTEERVVQISRVKRISSETRRWIRNHPSHLESGIHSGVEADTMSLLNNITAEGLSPGMLPDKLLDIRRTLSFDCLENRYIRWAIEEILRKVVDLRKTLLDTGNDKESSTFCFLNEVEDWCMKSLREYPVKGLSAAPLAGKFSHVLQWAGGYRDFHHMHLLLSYSLALSGRTLKLQLKNLHELYEYWCFLHIVQVLRKALVLISQDLISIESDGIVVRLAKGRRSELTFAGDNNREITLLYNPSFSWPDAELFGGQKPDIVLQFWKRKGKLRQHLATYIFDSKYRIETDKSYLKRYCCPGPPESAINQMHRYRDALFEHFAESGTPQRIAYGAYVIFPFHDERTFSESRFFRSVNTINIGAFPALPGHTLLLDDFLMHLLSKSGLCHDCSVAPLKLATWERFRNESRHLVLIIRVPPADKDMKWISSQKLCYIDAKPGNLRPSGARFIAFYEPEKQCIRCYASVSDVTLAQRSSINTPWTSRRNDDHQCWLFSIGTIEQIPNPIYQHMDRTPWRYANLYSLLHARSMKELILTTENERLIKEVLELNKITHDIKTSRWNIKDDDAQAVPEFHFINTRGLNCVIRSQNNGLPLLTEYGNGNILSESSLTLNNIINGSFI